MRTLFCFGYYLLFEYGVIARSYGLGVLLLLWAVVAWQRKSLLMTGVFLALAANTSIYALIIAGALLLGFLVETVFVRREFRPLFLATTACALAAAQLMVATAPDRAWSSASIRNP